VILINIKLKTPEGGSKSLNHSFSNKASGCILEWVIESSSLLICSKLQILSLTKHRFVLLGTVLLWLLLELLFHCQIDQTIYSELVFITYSIRARQDSLPGKILLVSAGVGLVSRTVGLLKCL